MTVVVQLVICNAEVLTAVNMSFSSEEDEIFLTQNSFQQASSSSDLDEDLGLLGNRRTPVPKPLQLHAKYSAAFSDVSDEEQLVATCISVEQKLKQEELAARFPPPVPDHVVADKSKKT